MSGAASELDLTGEGNENCKKRAIGLRDGPLENLWGRGGGGWRSTKKIFAQGKIK